MHIENGYINPQRIFLKGWNYYVEIGIGNVGILDKWWCSMKNSVRDCIDQQLSKLPK